MSTLKVPSLFEWLEIVRKCSGDYLKDLQVVQSIGQARMRKDFLDSLDIGDQVICFRASLICYGVTGSTQVLGRCNLGLYSQINTERTVWLQP